MGSDNLFHKRRTRKSKTLSRRRARRSEYSNILIICEGQKTEPKYFKEACLAYGLNPVNVRIDWKTHGLDPLSMVKVAERAYEKDPDLDEIYCVFDRDCHQTWARAHERIAMLQTRSRRPVPVTAIASVPCFEIWFLLHYFYSSKPYAHQGRTACESLIHDLKKHMPDYQKAAVDMFERCQPNLETAIKNAERLEKYHRTSGADNPSTQVHHLIKKFQDLKMAMA